MTNMKKPELLSPAGNFEKLRAAVRFGADAVYLAAKQFGMRSAADNFTAEELPQAVSYAHAHGCRVYQTVNTMPRQNEYGALEKVLCAAADAGVDALIVADLGVMQTARRVVPEMKLHVSTQASIVSAEAARAYLSLGACRVVLARELSLDEIAALTAALQGEGEVETFVHGSMCVSYSGRCLLSNHFTGRDGNRGQCAQPCRWNYTIYEEKRPTDGLGIEQHDEGTFILSSRDLCMIDHVPALIAAGIDSFKIEGRMKSAYYTAAVTNAYRMAIDRATADASFRSDPSLRRECESVSHRAYDTGYYFASPMQDAKTVTESGYLREKAYLATVVSYEPETKTAVFRQCNKVPADSDCELLTPGRTGIPVHIGVLHDSEGAQIPSAPHPGMLFSCEMPFAVKEGDILRS